MIKYYWEPGNGSRYDLFFGEAQGRYLLAWMRSGGSGGMAFAFSGGDYIHHTYLEEKMNLNSADAAGLLRFLAIMGHEVGMPDGDSYFPWAKLAVLRTLDGKGQLGEVEIEKRP